MTERDRFAFHPFDHAHLPEITDMWISGWTRAMPDIDFEARRSWFVDHLMSLIDYGVHVQLLFDTHEGTLAGFVTLSPASGHVDQLAVAFDYWGSGCSGLLLGWAKDVVRRQGKGLLFLEVNQDNLRAVKCYEREGFRRIREGTNPNSGRKIWRYEWRA